MKCKGAIFDMDGLLFDTERIYQETWREIAGERGIVLGDDFTKAISGTNGAHMCRVVESYYQVSDGSAVVEECMERVREKLSVHVPVKKGVHEILEFFKEEGIRMAVASSSAAEQIEYNLEKAGIRGYFSAVVSGTEVKTGKPAPDIFLCAAERIHCEPGTCFVFEDSENGIKAGHAAGCITIMIPDLIEASPGIMPYCTKICSDLLQAKRIIRKEFFMYILAPSLLGADFTMLGQQIHAVEQAGARYLHLDVMDGTFVPNISFGMPLISSIRKTTEMIFDVHMMVQEPGRYIQELKKAGADIITVHQEACTHLDWTIEEIKKAGMKAGVAINPATPVSTLDCILKQVDMILVMTVNPGFGGQRRILYTLDKVQELRQKLREREIEADIQVDGGVTPANAWEFLDAGANILVAGSSVFNGDAEKNAQEFMKILEEYNQK